MSEELTPRQQILLWDLISRGGSALQMDIKPKVEPKDREPLVRAKMVSYDPKKKPYRLAIEEAGWNRLSAVAPSLIGSGGAPNSDRPILQFVLARLQTYMASRAGEDPPLSYAAIFAGKPDEPGTDESVARRAIRPEPTLLSLETVIRSAFFDIAGRPARNQVRLRQLRERLSSIARQDLDNALIRMREEGRARLSTLSNPPDIAEEGDAALDIKNVSYHTIWIDT